MLTDYTNQQSRFDRAFCCTATCCSITCGACGRSYFVTSSGHGDYEPGELDELRSKAKAEPDKYIEVPDYSSVAFVQFGDEHIVIGCICDPTKRYSEWIEGNASAITEYLRLFWEDQKKKAEGELGEAEKMLTTLAEAPDG